jgi:hypothetical protein
MTHDDLAALIEKIAPDHLLRRAAIGFLLQGNGVQDVDKCLAYCEAKGLLCRVERGGVVKWYRDGPEVSVAPVFTPLPEPVPPVVVKPEPKKRQPPPITVAPQLF